MKFNFIGRFYSEKETVKSVYDIESTAKQYSLTSDQMFGLILTRNKHEFSSIEKDEFAIPNSPKFSMEILVTDDGRCRSLKSTVKGNEVYEAFMIFALLMTPVLLILMSWNKLPYSTGLGLLMSEALVYGILFKLNIDYVKKGVEELNKLHELLEVKK